MRLKVAIFLAALLCSCGDGATNGKRERSGAPRIFVSIPPQKIIAERVAGKGAAVGVLVGPGQSPHTYSPSSRQMAEIGGADVFFIVGLPFESVLIEKIAQTVPTLAIVDCTDGIVRRLVVEEAGHLHGQSGTEAHGTIAGGQRHECGHGCAHSDGTDPHVWLAPKNLVLMAGHMRDALSRLVPERKDEFAENCAGLAAELVALDAEIVEKLAGFRGRSVYVFHPAFGYFTDGLGLVQKAVEVDGKAPTGRELARIIAEAKADGIGTIFVQSQFDRKTAQAIADAIGAGVETLDPLAADVVANFRDMTDKLLSSFGSSDVAKGARN